MTANGHEIIDNLAEEFVARFRRGERPCVTEYADRCPEQADAIRELFPALLLMEEFKPRDAEALSGDRTPERLGEYRIVREVGRGGMGVVFEAMQEPLARRVALKVFNLGRYAGTPTLERFRREARVAARLHHTNIVPVFGVGEADGQHYYAMQFIDGHGLDAVLRDLRQLCGPDHAMIATGPSSATATTAGLSESGTSSYYRAVAKVGLQAAEALAHAHDRGIVHRDIKPSNLLLDEAGTLFITDFGLAKADDSDDLTGTGDLVGTVRYMAPERLRGQTLPASDLYGLGATLYEMLTLQPLFGDGERYDLIDRIRREEPRLPRAIDARIPRDLETIVLKCIAKEPAARYSSAGRLADDLRLFLTDRTICARRTSRLEQAWRWVKRNPALAVVGGAAVTFLITGLALTYAQWRRAEANAIQALDQADHAERSFQWAHGAIDTLLTDFAQLTHAREPGQLRTAQQQMLRNAVVLQDQFRELSPPTPRQRHELADAAFRSAMFRRALNDEAGAEAALRQVFALAEGNPGAPDPHLMHVVARAHLNLGFAYKDKRQLKAASAEFQRGLDILEKLPLDGHIGHEVRYNIAVAISVLAELSLQAGRPIESERRYAAAHARFAQLSQSMAPDRHEACQIRFLAAQHDVMWAALNYGLRKAAEELAYYQRAAAGADELLARKPDDAMFRKLAAQSYVGMADALRRSGDRLGAQPNYRTAIGHSRWLVEQFPHEPDYRAMHARTLNNAVSVLDPARTGEALLMTEEAVRHCWNAVAQRPDVRLYRSYLQACIDSASKAATNVADPGALERLAECFLSGPTWGQGEEAITACQLWCRAAAIPADEARTSANLGRALASLQQAIERGYRDVAQLSTSPTFAVLRGLPEYATITGKLSVPKD